MIRCLVKDFELSLSLGIVWQLLIGKGLVYLYHRARNRYQSRDLSAPRSGQSRRRRGPGLCPGHGAGAAGPTSRTSRCLRGRRSGLRPGRAALPGHQSRRRRHALCQLLRQGLSESSCNNKPCTFKVIRDEQFSTL